MIRTISKEPVGKSLVRKFIKEMIGSAGVRGVPEDTRLKLQVIQTSLTSISNRMNKLFSQQKVKCMVPVSAPGLGDVPMAIYETLNSQLLQTYSRDINGIILAYSDFEIPETAKVMWDLPHIIVPVTLRMLVFSPVPGVSLSGTVTKLAWDHIAMLVLGVFNATIPNEEFQRANKGIPEVGEAIEFYLDSLDVSSSPFVICGTFKKPTNDKIVLIENKKKMGRYGNKRWNKNTRGDADDDSNDNEVTAEKRKPQNTHKTFSDSDADDEEEEEEKEEEDHDVSSEKPAKVAKNE